MTPGRKFSTTTSAGRDQVLDEREVIRVLEVEGDALFAEIA